MLQCKGCSASAAFHLRDHFVPSGGHLGYVRSFGRSFGAQFSSFWGHVLSFWSHFGVILVALGGPGRDQGPEGASREAKRCHLVDFGKTVFEPMSILAYIS